MNKERLRIGFGFTGSFCNMEPALEALNELAKEGHEIRCFVTPDIVTTTTRFGTYKEFKQRMMDITTYEPIETVAQAEEYGPKFPIDLVVVAPATATSISKLVHGIYDNAVLMMTKANLRNHKPVVVGVSSNDLLGISGVNLMTLLTMKDLYLIPFGQDDYRRKPLSLVCDFKLLVPTVNAALEHRQLQPLLINYEGRTH